MRTRMLLTLVAATASLHGVQAADVTSMLWGPGEDTGFPSGRLPDFSHAGYYSGEKAIPDLPTTMNVLEFGGCPQRRRR